MIGVVSIIQYKNNNIPTLISNPIVAPKILKSIGAAFF